MLWKLWISLFILRVSLIMNGNVSLEGLWDKSLNELQLNIAQPKRLGSQGKIGLVHLPLLRMMDSPSFELGPRDATSHRQMPKMMPKIKKS